MKIFAVLFTATLLVAGLSNCNKTHAQSGVSPNLVQPPYSTGWSGVVDSAATGGGLSGGSTPAYNSSTNTVYFGYTQATVSQVYAFNQALQNSGMTITGYNYSWQYLNQGYSAGSLSANVNFAGTNGISLYSKTWNLGTTTNWTTVSGTENFANSGLTASSIANFSLSFTGKDNRYWAGYYGPQVRNPYLKLTYGADPKTYYNIPDDGYAQVNLPFTFPFEFEFSIKPPTLFRPTNPPLKSPEVATFPVATEN
mgnify:CR=1 FL=1